MVAAIMASGRNVSRTRLERNILCRRGVDQLLDLRLVLVHRRTSLNADQ